MRFPSAGFPALVLLKLLLSLLPKFFQYFKTSVIEYCYISIILQSAYPVNLFLFIVELEQEKHSFTKQKVRDLLFFKKKWKLGLRRNNTQIVIAFHLLIKKPQSHISGVGSRIIAIRIRAGTMAAVWAGTRKNQTFPLTAAGIFPKTLLQTRFVKVKETLRGAQMYRILVGGQQQKNPTA